MMALRSHSITKYTEHIPIELFRTNLMCVESVCERQRIQRKRFTGSCRSGVFKTTGTFLRVDPSIEIRAMKYPESDEIDLKSLRDVIHNQINE